MSAYREALSQLKATAHDLGQALEGAGIDLAPVPKGIPQACADLGLWARCKRIDGDAFLIQLAFALAEEYGGDQGAAAKRVNARLHKARHYVQEGH